MTCKDLNPGWRFRFYDDDRVRDYVARHAPQYTDVMSSLQTPVMKADFFRYLVLLIDGGVYLDVDVGCSTPFDDYLNVPDTEGAMFAAVEADLPLDKDPLSLSMTSRRQLLQWAIAAPAGHPVLQGLVDTIAARVRRMPAGFAPRSLFEVMDTTGPGAFSRAVHGFTNAQITQGLPLREQRWRVHVSPRASWGYPSGSLAVHPTVQAQHYYAGSWKNRDSIRRNFWPAEGRHALLPADWSDPAVSNQVIPGNLLSVSWLDHRDSGKLKLRPLVDVIVPFSSPNSSKFRADYYSLTDTGVWQPGLPAWITSQLTIVDIVLASLAGDTRAPTQGLAGDASASACPFAPVQGTEARRQAPLFVDIGADIAYFSLVAAAAGHCVVAHEPDPTLHELAHRSAALSALQPRLWLAPGSRGLAQFRTVLATAVKHMYMAPPPRARPGFRPRLTVAQDPVSSSAADSRAPVVVRMSTENGTTALDELRHLLAAVEALKVPGAVPVDAPDMQPMWRPASAAAVLLEISTAELAAQLELLNAILQLPPHDFCRHEVLRSASGTPPQNSAGADCGRPRRLEDLDFKRSTLLTALKLVRELTSTDAAAVYLITGVNRDTAPCFPGGEISAKDDPCADLWPAHAARFAPLAEPATVEAMLQPFGCSLASILGGGLGVKVHETAEDRDPRYILFRSCWRR